MINKADLNSNILKQYVSTELAQLANPAKAAEMAAYMKTAMPFYGVQKPERLPIIKEFKKSFAPGSYAQYEANVLALWQGEFREEKYLAINYAETFKDYIVPQAIPLYECLVREGGWWDFVDPIASLLVGKVLLENEKRIRPVIETYLLDEDFWIKRVALLAHLGHKKATNSSCLFRYCSSLAGEKEFFIRKAIGWILREYSKSEPEKVVRYLQANKESLSPLSYREGAKHLIKAGMISEE